MPLELWPVEQGQVVARVTGAASPARGGSTLVGVDGEMFYRGRVLLFRIFEGGWRAIYKELCPKVVPQITAKNNYLSTLTFLPLRIFLFLFLFLSPKTRF